MFFSKYNIEIKKNDKYLIYNTKSEKEYVSEFSLNDLEEMLSNNKIDENQKRILKDIGIITDDANEFESALKKVIEYKENNAILHLLIYVTDACNCLCVYCPQNNISKSLSFSDIRKIIAFVESKIKDVQLLNIEWFGGEPLLCIDTIKILSRAFIVLCTKYNVNYSAGIITNGTLLDNECFIKLTQFHVISYQITIDGLEDNHNKQRPLANGGNCFRTIVDNLTNIIENHSEEDIKFIIRINISKSFLKEIDDYCAFFNEHFGKDKRFSLRIRFVYNWGGDKIDEFSNELIEDINEYKRIYKIFRSSGVRIVEGDTKNLFFSVCEAAKTNYFGIAADCKVYKCTLFRDNNSEIGYIDEKGNLVLYDKAKYEYMLSANNRTEACKSCKIAPHCMGYSCPYRNYDGSKYLCNNRFKDIESFLMLD